jgi:hypothetical protein
VTTDDAQISRVQSEVHWAQAKGATRLASAFPCFFPGVLGKHCYKVVSSKCYVGCFVNDFVTHLNIVLICSNAHNSLVVDQVASYGAPLVFGIVCK